MIGITSTIPVEIVFAAGLVPVDLNNLFISSATPHKLVAQSESIGFSYNTCAWIKGIYSVIMDKGIRQIIAVTGGDCSNTIALGELLVRKGIRVIPFEYPQDREGKRLWLQLDRLRQRLGTTWERIEKTKSELDHIRAKLKRLDQLTWRENQVTGQENHLFLVQSSDFNGDPEKFEKDLDQFLDAALKRDPFPHQIRLGFLGVPPIFLGLYEFMESLGARVVFNEIQRQFSMPYERPDMVDQYLKYTYPYDVDARLDDIRQAVKERRLDGLIHYTQTFCHRQIYDMVFREALHLPILTIEGDRPGPLDSRTSLRIETFVEMLKRKERK